MRKLLIYDPIALAFERDMYNGRPMLLL